MNTGLVLPVLGLLSPLKILPFLVGLSIQKRGVRRYRQKDSILLLEDFLDYVFFGPVYPIRNRYFGESEDFTLYEKYHKKSRKLCERITKTLDFPALADIIADDFYTGGKTIPETIEHLGAFAGQSFLSWRNQVYEMYESTGEFNALEGFTHQQTGDE